MCKKIWPPPNIEIDESVKFMWYAEWNGPPKLEYRAIKGVTKDSVILKEPIVLSNTVIYGYPFKHNYSFLYTASFDEAKSVLLKNLRLEREKFFKEFEEERKSYEKTLELLKQWIKIVNSIDI